MGGTEPNLKMVYATIHSLLFRSFLFFFHAVLFRDDVLYMVVCSVIGYGSTITEGVEVFLS